MGRFLVTGTAGFVGSAVASALLARGHSVVGIDNLSNGFLKNVPVGTKLFKGDCQDEQVYTRLPEGAYDAIFHLAGQSSGEVSFDDPVYDLRTNTESTLHLLRFALSRGCKRFIYASSMSVYGQQPLEPVQEDAPTFPLSFYGVGKLASEHYLRIYEQFGISSTCLRLFNIYGPGQNMGNLRQGMVSIFMAMMVKDKHIHVRGTPNRFRDFVYIDDVVAACLACLERPQSGGKALNVGGSGRVQVGELIEKLRALSDVPITVEYSGCTAGDMFGIHADLSQAAKYLGYEPEVGIDEGLRRMYDWYLKEKAES
ncbi:MAG: NAD-dependent epimerase/dehydratase family protein [Desulfovibrionaceae bacterium]|nr:NAD-dependent epimerase/dehydratase family protein [Desulfovibrionaceae bacterium]